MVASIRNLADRCFLFLDVPALKLNIIIVVVVAVVVVVVIIIIIIIIIIIHIFNNSNIPHF